MLNAAVAESLKQYADRLEGVEDFNTALHLMIKKTIKDHKRIIFNGNGYDEAWIKEAERRGLSNYRTTPDCMPHLLDEKNVKMLVSQGVYSESELRSRCDIMLDNYCKAVLIEAETMVDMAEKQIVPAVEKYVCKICETAISKKNLSPDISCDYEHGIVKKLSVLVDRTAAFTEELKEAVVHVKDFCDIISEANYIRDRILPCMSALRAVADEAETKMATEYWPFPTYGELLFGVR